MVSKETMSEATNRLVKAYKPIRIYLYGDYADGTANEESSACFLIIVESSNRKAIARGYLGFEALLDLEIPSNIAVFTRDEFEKYLNDPHSTTAEIVKTGKVVYARA